MTILKKNPNRKDFNNIVEIFENNKKEIIPTLKRVKPDNANEFPDFLKRVKYSQDDSSENDDDFSDDMSSVDSNDEDITYKDIYEDKVFVYSFAKFVISLLIDIEPPYYTIPYKKYEFDVNDGGEKIYIQMNEEFVNLLNDIYNNVDEKKLDIGSPLRKKMEIERNNDKSPLKKKKPDTPRHASVKQIPLPMEIPHSDTQIPPNMLPENNTNSNSVSVLSKEDPEKLKNKTEQIIQGLSFMNSFAVAVFPSNISCVINSLLDAMDIEIVEEEEEEIEEEEIEGGGVNIDSSVSQYDDILKTFLKRIGLSKQIHEIPHDFNHTDMKGITRDMFHYIHDHLKNKFENVYKGQYKTHVIQNFINDLIMNYDIKDKKVFTNEWEYYKTINDYILEKYSDKDKINENYKYVKAFNVNFHTTDTDPVMIFIRNRFHIFKRKGFIKFFLKGKTDAQLDKNQKEGEEKSIFYCDELCRPIKDDAATPILDVKKMRFNFDDSSYGQMKYNAPLLEYSGLNLKEKETDYDGIYTFRTCYTPEVMKNYNRSAFNVANSLDPSSTPAYILKNKDDDSEDITFVETCKKSSPYKYLEKSDHNFINSFLIKEDEGLYIDDISDEKTALKYIAKQAAIRAFQHSIDKFEINNVIVEDVYFGLNDENDEYSKVCFKITKGEQQPPETETICLEFVDKDSRQNPPNSIGQISKALQALNENDEAINEDKYPFIFNYLKLKNPESSSLPDDHRRKKFFIISIKGDGDADQVEYMYNYRNVFDEVVSNPKYESTLWNKPTFKKYKNSMFIGTVDKNVFAHAMLQDVPCVMTDAGIETTIPIKEKNRWFFDNIAFEQILHIIMLDDMETIGTDGLKRKTTLNDVIHKADINGPKRNYKTLQCISTYGVMYKNNYTEDMVEELKTSIINYIQRYNERMEDEDKTLIQGAIENVFKKEDVSTEYVSTEDVIKIQYFAYKLLYEDMIVIIDFNKSLKNIINLRIKINTIMIDYLKDNIFNIKSMDKYRIDVKNENTIKKDLKKLEELYKTSLQRDYSRGYSHGYLNVDNQQLNTIRKICKHLSKDIEPIRFDENIKDKIKNYTGTLRSRTAKKFMNRPDIQDIIETINDIDKTLTEKFGVDFQDPLQKEEGNGEEELGGGSRIRSSSKTRHNRVNKKKSKKTNKNRGWMW